MDYYSEFRQDSSRGQAVSVNHKALITRALTKYPVDHALFRELLQNSADAKSNSARIQFISSSSDTAPTSIYTIPINRLRFSNDGADFRDEDWARLREIASGNPNEAKIGTFGVGFYSVFELTDEPLVHSGHQIMNFRYEGVQLHYYFSDNVPKYQKGTLIDLPYKKEGELRDIDSFVGFLVQSFLLVNLNEISLEVKYADGTTVSLLHLVKDYMAPTTLTSPPGLNSVSPNRTLKLARLQKTDFKVSIEYLNATQQPPLTISKGYFSFGQQFVNTLLGNTKKPEEYTKVECYLTRVDASVSVNVSSNFRDKMIETLLKPPPKQATMSLLSFTEELSKDVSSQLRSYIFPKEANDAKIFIGFSTKQSTGFKSHLALPAIIPTMERTAVDLSHQFVKDWNCEMLYMAGIMARCAYEYELKLCQQPRPGVKSNEAASFICSRFKFEASAPDTIVGEYIRGGFWNCTPQTLVPSSKGVLPNNQVKLAGDIAPILRTTPVVIHKDLAKELARLKYMKSVSYAEIADDIGVSPLSMSQGLEYIQWLTKKWPDLDDLEKTQLLSPLKIEAGNGVIVDIGSSIYYHDRSVLPDEEVSKNLPKACIPSDAALTISHKHLSTLGFRSLNPLVWVKCRLQVLAGEPPKTVVTKRKLEIAKDFLKVASRTWVRLRVADREELAHMLNSTPCLPTQKGLSLPKDTYVDAIRLFPDLPVVSKELELPKSWLKSIGVRESMDMVVVLDALTGKKLEWSNVDLVQYLCDHQNSLKKSDWDVVRMGRFFRQSDSKDDQLYRASELYAPDSKLKLLGVPILSFPNWNHSSREAMMLHSIGLRRYPDPTVLFNNITSNAKADVAISYFLLHYVDAKYSVAKLSNVKFIPTTKLGVFATPTECFWDSKLEAFGECIMDAKYVSAAAQLGVRRSPLISVLLNRVLDNPAKYLTSVSQCDAVFLYLSQDCSELNRQDLQNCRNTAFIPIRNNKDSSLTWATPKDVYLPSKASDPSEDPYRPLLQTIHPRPGALAFLRLIGISERPTVEQLVRLVVRNPLGAYSKINSHEAYEALLCQMYDTWPSIAKNVPLVTAMKTSQFLIGVKHYIDDKSREPLEEYSLYRASDLALVDDVIIFNQFKTIVVTAPQVEKLEGLYRNLGIPRLTELLREDVQVGPSINSESTRVKLEHRIKERLKLFVENTSNKIKDNCSSIRVELVQSIHMHRQLPPHASITISTSSCLSPTDDNVLLVVADKLEWIDVATALSKKMLARPNQDSVVVMEIQLSADLSVLERKGYNVSRLRNNIPKKYSNKNLFEADGGASPHQQQKPMSQLSPRQQPREQRQGEQSVGELDEMQSQAGQQQASRQAQQQTQQQAPQQAPQQAQQQQAVQRQRLQRPQQVGGFFQKLGSLVNNLTTGQPQVGSSSMDVKSALNNGKNQTRAYTGNVLQSSSHVDTPTLPPPIQFCDENYVYDIEKIHTLPNGIQVFSSPSRPTPQQSEAVLSESLLTLCQIFDCSSQSVHIYRDHHTTTLAFNKDGSLFFNSCVKPETENILHFYFPMMAHELAHNLVASHGASHTFYTEAYMQHSLKRYDEFNKQF